MDPVKNFAYGELNSTGMTSSATSFGFITGQGSRFPATSGGAYNVVIYDKLYGSAATAYQAGAAEIVRINTLATDTVSSCTRAQEGTTALDFNNPLKMYRVERVLTAKDFTDIATEAALVSAKADGFLLTQPSSSQTTNTTTKMGMVTGRLGSTGQNKFYFERACAIKNLSVSAAFTNTSDLTVTLFQGTGTGSSSATALTTTLTATGTVKIHGSDLSNSISIAAGDWVEFEVTVGAVLPQYTVYVEVYY